MIAEVRCEGAPRDLDLDQGIACREAIRADARAGGASRLREVAARVGLSVRSRHAALARDLRRHFPHLAERTDGLASGAGVSSGALLAKLAREFGRPDASLLEDAGVEAGVSDSLWASFRAPLSEAGIIVRRVRPDGGYPNLTLGRPGLAASLAGVNEPGLAMAGIVLAPPGIGEACQAPALLLVEGCLERLDGVEKALEWCERRPGGGRARLVFADAAGASGAIEIDGEKRQRIDAARGASAGAPPGVRIEPAARCLAIELPGRPIERFGLG